jgi:hypothetical protein
MAIFGLSQSPAFDQHRKVELPGSQSFQIGLTD